MSAGFSPYAMRRVRNSPRGTRTASSRAVVFQGNHVKDTNAAWAVFQDLSSNLATMEASKVVDAYGLFPGHSVEQADAQQAYTQSELEGIPTWIRLPPDARPASWAHCRDPVCALRLALYGHPDSGGFWERHCEKHLKLQGFVSIPEWKSCYWHPELKLLLSVYVDDFKLAGPVTSIPKGWELITKGLRIGPSGPIGLYLGCVHKLKDSRTADGHSIRSMEYDMSSFLLSCVDKYRLLVPKASHLPSSYTIPGCHQGGT